MTTFYEIAGDQAMQLYLIPSKIHAVAPLVHQSNNIMTDKISNRKKNWATSLVY